MQKRYFLSYGPQFLPALETTENLETVNIIHFIPKWPPFWYSFVYLQINPCCLVNGKIFFEFQLKNEAARANLQVNERKLKWRPFWNKVYYDQGMAIDGHDGSY